MTVLEPPSARMWCFMVAAQEESKKRAHFPMLSGLNDRKEGKEGS
jgi:hypothetical protein